MTSDEQPQDPDSTSAVESSLGEGNEESVVETPAPFDQIREACKTFTAEWEAGGQTDLPSYLVKVAQDDQATLLRNLLEYEIHKRREQGESPRANDYLEKLPDHTAIIRQVFLETSRLSLTGDQVSVTQELPLDQLPASRLGEFRLIRELGRGGMGSVFEAVHVKRGHRVALKTLPAVTPDTLHRFKREFRLAAELIHPNLVSLHTLENDGGQYFITMDLVDGVDFRSWVRPHGTRALDRILVAVPQLVAAVMALHAQGMVHRDLKPHNVLVTSEGRVVVLDFGLVAEMAGATASLGKIAGTPPYMAPEQAAGDAVGPPADWYAVGAMLYEAIAGCLPFESNDVWELLRLKQDRDAPPLPDDSEVPPEFSELCMSLLARSPADRPDPMEIAGVVHTPLTVNLAKAGDSDELIGRESHLAALGDAQDEMTRSGDPVIVFIHGRSGEGKTSLAERFLARFRRSSAVVLSGRCYDRESVPFKALDTLIGALTDHLRSLPRERAAQLLPDDIGMLAQLFPELRRCEVIATAPAPRIDSIDQQQIRARAFGALRLLLDRISAGTPMVIFIDDLQWGDEDSARALFEVLRPPTAPPVLFLGSYRSDEADDSPFLTAWRELQRVNDVEFVEHEVGVGPLSVEQSTQLMLNQLGLDTEVIRRRATQFHTQTGGNPFLLTELIGCFDPESDSFHATDIYGVLDQKLEALPPDARPLLETISVAGQALDADDAISATDSASSFDDILIAMRNSRLVRVVGTKIDTYHDRIRHAVVDRMAAPDLRTMHERLAQVIEQKHGGLSEEDLGVLVSTGELPSSKSLPRVFDLAYHWDAAANQRRALGYGLAAAEQARKQFAQDVAAEQFALAGRHSAEAPRIVQYRIARGRGEAMMFASRFDDAKVELDLAHDLADEDYDVAEVIGLKGDLYRSLGMIEDGVKFLEDAIGRVGVRVPTSSTRLWWETLKETSVQIGHSLMPSRLHRRASDRSHELCNKLLGQAEYCYYMQSVPKLVWASMVGLNRAERVEKSSSLALQYIVHANDMAVLGWHKRAEAYYNSAVDLSHQLNDQRLAAVAISHHAFGSLAAAKYEMGVEKAQSALDLLTKVGDFFEWEGAQIWLAMNEYRLGNMDRAINAAREALQSCVRHDHQFVSILALLFLSKSTGGAIPYDELINSISVPHGHRVGESASFMAEGYWHSYHKRTEKSIESFEKAWNVCKKFQCLTTFNMSVLSDLVTCLRTHAESLEDRGLESSAFRRRWEKGARWSNRLSRLLPPERPHALRELSLVHAHRGRMKKAVRLIDRSCEIADQQHAVYEHAKSQRVAGQLARKLGDAGAEEQIRIAQSTIDEIERAALCALNLNESA